MKVVSSVSKVHNSLIKVGKLIYQILNSNGIKYVASEEIAAYFGSKLNMYNVLTIDCKYICHLIQNSGVYLPGYLACSTEFIRDLWSKKKKVAKLMSLFFN